jgi:hypothetical protein
MHTKFWSENPKGRGHSEDQRPRSRWRDNIRMDWGIGWEGVAWMHLAQDRDKLQAFENTVMNLFGCHKWWGIS